MRAVRDAHPRPGVRRPAVGELVALTVRRVDLVRRRIEVVEAITEVHGRVVVGTTMAVDDRSGNTGTPPFAPPADRPM
ncbi:MAG TPA: hypothetical protein VGS60_19655 [Actinomycetes bacterium]|nr:hypothetical protein [Actinomycetes bacterium]